MNVKAEAGGINVVRNEVCIVACGEEDVDGYACRYEIVGTGTSDRFYRGRDQDCRCMREIGDGRGSNQMKGCDGSSRQGLL